MESGPGICVGRGPRAVEELLLAELEELVEQGRREPALLSSPVWVVVPSRSLAQHLQAALVRRSGRPVLGCAIQTLRGLAFEIVARAGAPAPAAEALFPVLVRQLAGREAALRERLDGLVDGYGIVEANVADLLDAGFEAAHAEALEEGIRAAAPAGGLQKRSLAVARVAARALEAIDAGRVGHRSVLFRRAREILERDPEGALRARAVLIHGYADATGVQTDLLEALVRCRGARVFLDRPLDPSRPATEDPGVAFSRRFSARFLGGLAPPDRAPPPPASVEVWRAPGPEAEVAAVAARLRELLDAGAMPERIGVVARELGGYRLALRRHLGRLGIPFSGLATPGPPGPAARRLGALLALLRLRDRTPAERWLEALSLARRRFGERERADLRLAFHCAGAARLAEVADQPTAEEESQAQDVPLPVRQGLWAPEEGEGVRAPRRRLSRALFDAAIRAARVLRRQLEGLGPGEPLGRQLERLEAIAEKGLGWCAGSFELEELRGIREESAADLGFELDREGFLLLLENRLRHAGCDSLGGEGAGVQVLGVMEARARSFEQLFVLGLNRDLFPRAITEDPLLPDDLRTRLRAVLPDLPVKGEGHDEERFLFAQLLSSSAAVTLSCAITDEDGKPRSPSPLLERLQMAERVLERRELPAPHGPGALACRAPRPAHEQARLAGLHGTRRQFGELLPLAIEEAWRDADAAPDAKALAAARLGVLGEVDAAAEERRGLGPYFGFVGPTRAAADPRREPLYVTTAERVAACPWQAFVGRLLRLEAPPDALDALPAAEPRLVGALVHAALEEVVGRALGRRGGSLEDLMGYEAAAIAWPDEPALEELLHDHARRLLSDEGIAWPGFERVLVLHARPRLEVARSLGLEAVLGAEVEGSVSVGGEAGGSRTLRFKVDRADRLDGGLRLLDYKTGKPIARQKRAESRRTKLLERVREGTLLQAVAYARAGRELGGGEAEGCYLGLDPDPDLRAEQRLLGARADDEEFAEAFDASVRAVFAALDAGSLFPRLVKAGTDLEPSRCQSCAVKEACLRGDSGARARLAAWAAQPPRRGLSQAEQALLRLWALGGEAS
jgi:RecB family exonuclease